MIMVEVGAAHVPNAATPQERQLELNDLHHLFSSISLLSKSHSNTIHFPRRMVLANLRDPVSGLHCGRTALVFLGKVKKDPPLDG